MSVRKASIRVLACRWVLRILLFRVRGNVCECEYLASSVH